MSAYDGNTMADIIHDFAVVRGDLSEQYARDQLVQIIEGRMALGRSVTLRRAIAMLEAEDWWGFRDEVERFRSPDQYTYSDHYSMGDNDGKIRCIEALRALVSDERSEEWKAARRGICWVCGWRRPEFADTSHPCLMDDGS